MKLKHDTQKLLFVRDDLYYDNWGLHSLSMKEGFHILTLFLLPLTMYIKIKGKNLNFFT